MYTHFLKYSQEKKLFTEDHKILLAVSGGIDSMVMAHLFLHSSIHTGIAHCNFNLRGEESNGDETFVKQWAEKNNIPFFSIRFDTKQYAEVHNLSTQMAARTLRYNWFEELLHTHGYDRLAVAHHADDNVETVLLNLTRGTGLRGICGIAPINGHIIRPLLFATREQITRYAEEQHLAFREDRSNASDDYARNRIRHHVTPELKTLNPSLADTFRQNSEYLTQAYTLLEEAVTKHKAEWCHKQQDEWHIDLKPLQQTAAPGFWLFELLHDFGFNSTQTDDIAKALHEQAGKRFFSPTHELLKDRDKLIITLKTPSHPLPHLTVKETDTCLHSPLSLVFERLHNNPPQTILPDKNMAFLDADKLHFPLTVRLWQEGDSFIPFGMKGKKKLSDYFIDHKIPLHHKAQQWVVVSDNNIVWLVGQRPDERYKVTPQTQHIFKITWNANQPG
jgi:tRNA(Ile)-lysidine synthase